MRGSGNPSIPAGTNGAPEQFQSECAPIVSPPVRFDGHGRTGMARLRFACSKKASPSVHVKTPSWRSTGSINELTAPEIPIDKQTRRMHYAGTVNSYQESKMATGINLEKMSLDDLKKLRGDVEKAIKSFEARQRKEARKALEKVAKDYGVSLDEVVGGGKSSKRTSKAAPQFRNPNNPDETWSGRGRQPAWYKQAIAAGKSRDDLKI